MTLRITYLIGTDPGILAVLDYTEGEVQSLVERLAAGGLSVSTQSLVLKLVSTIEEVSLHGEHGFRFKSIEWMPEGDAPEILPSTQLLRAAIAARHALRSYQYGNESTELAEEIADSLDAAIGLY